MNGYDTGSATSTNIYWGNCGIHLKEPHVFYRCLITLLVRNQVRLLSCHSDGRSCIAPRIVRHLSIGSCYRFIVYCSPSRLSAHLAIIPPPVDGVRSSRKNDPPPKIGEEENWLQTFGGVTAEKQEVRAVRPWERRGLSLPLRETLAVLRPFLRAPEPGLECRLDRHSNIGRWMAHTPTRDVDRSDRVQIRRLPQILSQSN